MEGMISMLPSFARQSAPEKYAHGIGAYNSEPLRLYRHESLSHWVYCQ